jgi:hypothetical protein
VWRRDASAAPLPPPAASHLRYNSLSLGLLPWAGQLAAQVVCFHVKLPRPAVFRCLQAAAAGALPLPLPPAPAVSLLSRSFVAAPAVFEFLDRVICSTAHEARNKWAGGVIWPSVVPRVHRCTPADAPLAASHLLAADNYSFQASVRPALRN